MPHKTWQQTVFSAELPTEVSMDTSSRLITKGEGGREEQGEKNSPVPFFTLPQEITPSSSCCGPG